MTTRWFVEVSPVDADTLKERYCVEALQWQQALQQARKLRGDKGPLSRFSIELLEAGYRATDPAVRLRYTVSKAPGDAPLTGNAANGSGAGHAPAPAIVVPAASVSAAAVTAPPAVAATAVAVTAAAAGTAPRDAPAASATVAAPSVVESAVPRPGPSSSAFRAVAPVSARPDGQPAGPSRIPLPGRGPLGHQSTSPAVPRPFRPPAGEEPAPAAGHAPAADTNAPADPAGAHPEAPAGEPVPVPAPVVTALPQDGTPAEEPIPSLPGLALISRRSEEPKEGTPITYREYAFAVEPGLTPKDLDRYARATWEQVRTALASRTSGKFVQIALFDHHFSSRPERPPVAVLAWKDWRGDPVIQIRGAAPAAAPVTAAPVAAAPVTAAPVTAAPASAAPVAAAPVATAPAPQVIVAATAEPAPSAAAGAFPPATPPARPPSERPLASRPLAPVETASGRRGPSEDLISELFEEMHQLRFMPDIVTGAEYVLNVLGRVLPCEGVLVHVFDINTRQFVVVRAVGPTSQNALLQRTPDTFPTFRETFRRARTLSFRNVDGEEAFRDGRWERLGVNPTIALCGAVQQGGRYLGVIELANPKGGDAFHDSEINAVDYICEQFADFVASRPIILDDDAVIPRA